MTQKDKVKELVGRGLHSYHTKALQQMDRIEKKNKEQNHKISILTNELDNDYLTKTEEGSVISLEHSKEGMIYLDELQGNTLVNYCTDGSKEMTLNGDIDLEGTFVTTTEGVDNGKVDIMCEGNTLVNLSDINTVTLTSGDERITNLSKIKPNTKYTQIIRVLENSLKEGNERNVVAVINETDRNTKYSLFPQIDIMKNFVGIKKQVFTTPSTIDSIYTFGTQIRAYTINTSGNIKIQELLIEGEFDETLPYFEGMKSVGQDDENDHKIEILSQNKNLFNINETDVYSSGTRCEKNGNSIRIIPTSTPYWASYNIKIKGFKNGETYTLSCISDNYHLPKSRIALYERATNTNVGSWDRNYFTIPNNVNVEDIYLRIHCCEQDITNIREVEISDILIEKGQAKTQFIPYAINKKEILLNEPLRKANDFYRDRLVKIGNKCYIERNTKEVVLDGTHNVAISGTSVKDETLCRFDFTINGLIKGSNGGEDKKFICDKFPYLFIHALAGGSTNVTQECISNHSTNENSLNMVIKKSRLETIDVTGVNKWLSNNNIKIIIPIATPTYEPLEIEPILNAYNDVTHFSNNSIIPCNMKVQNSGYNAIIKPSTLYTITLDTNKSGTIGMNLGGTKGTTTNNVATITTPATLTDDSLRIYGKGIKGSKVRILEGDKTNWIPSHFEGMKSSFEDKIQDDGTYKMEILSKNRNLLEVEKLIDADNYIKGTYSSIKIPLKPNTRYYYNFDFQPNNIHRWVGVFSEPKSFKGSITKPLVWNEVKDGIKSGYIQTDNSTEYYLSLYQPNVNYHTNDWYKELFTTVCKNFVISEIESEYIDGLSNKIQFSSIEPLRSVNLRNGYVKDKLILKDGKLVIERNCKKIVLDGTQVLSKHADQSKDGTSLFGTGDLTPERPSYHVECDSFGSSGNNLMTHTTFANVEGIGCWSTKKNFNIRIKTCRLKEDSNNGMMEYVRENPITIIYPTSEPTYEEIPFELQKIILEGYENGTLFFDTNIPPTSTITYAGETPIVKVTKLNKTEVLNNTNDINDNIVPYLMDMDYRVVCLQLQSEGFNGGIEMARLFGGAYEMLKRDILSKRLSKEEYGYRLIDYFNAGKLTEEEVRELEDLK